METSQDVFRKLSKEFKIKTPDIIGYRHGKMVIVKFIELKGKSVKDSRWLAKCDCGNEEMRTYRTFLNGFIRKTNDCCNECFEKENNHGVSHLQTNRDKNL